MKKTLTAILFAITLSATAQPVLLKNNIPVTETNAGGTYVVRVTNGYTINVRLDSVPQFTGHFTDITSVQLQQKYCDTCAWLPFACANTDGYANIHEKAKYRYRIYHWYDWYANGYFYKQELLFTIPFYVRYYSN